MPYNLKQPNDMNKIDIEIQKLFPIAEAYGLRLNRLYELRIAIDIYSKIQDEFLMLLIELNLFLEDG